MPDCLKDKSNRHRDVQSLLERLNHLRVAGRRFNERYLLLRAHRRGAQGFKQNENLTEYQNEETYVYRNFENDRHFPLETVSLVSHNINHDTDLSEATIHIGSTVDEYVRSFNALAITMGKNIFFRHGAYKPETEEGRKIIAHELTHVAQHEEGRITETSSTEELEQEACSQETLEEYDPDPLEEVEIGGEIFHVRPSEHPEIIRDAAAITERWFEKQKVILGEQEYLRLLAKYALWKERRI